MKKILLLIVLSPLIQTLYSQNIISDTFWEPAIFSALQLEDAATKQTIPSVYKAYKITSFQELLGELQQASKDGESINTTIISVPYPDGTFRAFKVFKNNVIPEELKVKYPGIETFSGYQVDKPHVKAKFDYTLHGFHGLILEDKNIAVIEPLARNVNQYLVYNKADVIKTNDWQCYVDAPVGEPDIITARAGDCQFREYRLALGATFEYFNFHGSTVASALSAMTTTINNVNAVFEREASLTMVLVPNTDQLIGTTTNDGYTNNDIFAMLSQNQTKCDNVIGNANYDIGHVFGTNGGGLALIRSTCNRSKAWGVSSYNTPTGPYFDIDYVSHEVGHQFGAEHTSNNSCNGNRSASSSYEPGSGSTIMSYAGVCAPNIQAASDPYYHAINIAQIGNYVTNAGNCATIINTTNTVPTVSAGADYTIPANTPFFLTAVGNDADEDPVTYTWEQWDRQISPQPPTSTATVGPNYRSLEPTTSPVRYLPALSTVAAGGTDQWEVLSNVSRYLNFRVTIRDNNVVYGCTESDNVRITVNAAAGSFQVTSQNAAATWTPQTMETVTWNVAGSDVGNVNCNNVDILFSTDNGASFPTTLLSNVPNDGSQDVTVPNVTTATGRIMVVCSDNIFYNLNAAPITIDAIVLPVEFLSFNANKNGNMVYIDWATASETNSKSFEIERSGNGVDYVTIGEVPAAGFSQQQIDYTWVDNSPVNNYNYYRLRQVDLDGSADYSPVRIVDFSNTREMSIFPNPANENIYITKLPENSTVQLYTGVGQLVYADENPTANTTISVSNLSAGLYLLVVTNENGSRQTEKVIISK